MFDLVFDWFTDFFGVSGFCQARVVPDTAAELIEYFLDTEAQEIEYEIARLRGRLVNLSVAHHVFDELSL